MYVKKLLRRKKMNAKKMFALLLSVLMVVTCFAGMLSVSADEADKFAPTNEEPLEVFTGTQTTPHGGYGPGQSFGAKVVVPNGKRLTQINFHSLPTYNTNTNHIEFRVYQWDTDYKTTVAGEVLAQKTVINHVDNAPLDVILPTNRNLTGELLWVATYVSGASQMTPLAFDGTLNDGVICFANGNKASTPFMFSLTVGDELTVQPASYTATFVADGAEVAKVTFLEGDTELINVPAVPAKEGFWADWSAYTLGNEDITIEAIYTDASGAVKPQIEDATKIDAFAEDHYEFFKGDGCAVRVNRDGSVSFVGTWGIDGDVDAYATIEYMRMMKKYYTGWDGNNSIPNKSQKFNVIAVKVKAPAVCLESDPNMTVMVGRSTEIYGMEIANSIKCDGSEEYWIFDFSSEPDFSANIIQNMKINWAYSVGEESNIGADFQILGIQLFDTLENALAVTGGEEATEAPTEAKTEAPETEAPETQAPATQAPETQAPAKEGGCASVVGFGAVAILAAAAAVVALKKKD